MVTSGDAMAGRMDDAGKARDGCRDSKQRMRCVSRASGTNSESAMRRLYWRDCCVDRVAPPQHHFSRLFASADTYMMRPLTIAASLLLALPTIAAAQQAAAPAAGDAAKGKQLTYTCQGCHGVTGYKNAYPNYHVPRIGGQSAQYLLNALTEYKQGKRKHPTMQAQAESFSDQDIADIAAYLSSLK
jgi:cytochrome c553